MCRKDKKMSVGRKGECRWDVDGMDSFTKFGRCGFWVLVGCLRGGYDIFIIFIIFYISCCRYGIYFIVCKRCDGEHMFYINGLEIVNHPRYVGSNIMRV